MWPAIALALLAVDYGPLPGFTPKPSSTVVIGDPAGPLDHSRVDDTTNITAQVVTDVLLRQRLAPSHPQYLSDTDLLYRRYIWMPPWANASWLGVHITQVNSVCSSLRNDVLVQPEILENGRLVAWDLRKLAPDHNDLQLLLITWRSMSVQEPYFHVEVPAIVGTVATYPHEHIDGKVYHARKFVPAPHVLEGYTFLEKVTHCFAPLLRADDFLRRISSTQENGRYYHFMTFIRHGKRLNEREIDALFGISINLSRFVKGDDRAAMFQSAVSGKTRTVEQNKGALGYKRTTYDINDGDVDPFRHGIYNLLDFVNKARGKEIIYERANGLYAYMLTDGVGNLVDVAPSTIATDHMVPAPHSANLYPSISCIRCHGPTGGVQLVRNEVPTLLGGNVGDIDLFDDLSSAADREATIARIVGLYAAGDKFQEDLFTSKSRYADAVFRCTDGLGAKEEDTTVKFASELSSQFGRYWYSQDLFNGNVNADVAMLELGIQVKPGEGPITMRRVMPYRRADLVIDGNTVELTDPALGALKRGLSIRRQDWQRVYAYAAYLMSQYRKE